MKVPIAACGRLLRYNTQAQCRKRRPKPRAQARYSGPLMWMAYGSRLTASRIRVYSRICSLV
ncbi:hypothetical protein D3C80_2086770 [compost metagenome]